MKKSVAVCLCIALLMCSLSACRAPETKAIPTLADCGTVSGMLVHKNASNYSYAESDDIISTPNALFVPKGTVISSEANMAVYTYDERMLLKKELLSDIGQSTVGDYAVMMASDELTVTEDCYIRAAVCGTLDELVLTYPEDRKSEVRVYDLQYEAYQKDYDRIVPLLKQTSADTVNYIFITDLHNDLDDISEAQANSLKKQMEQVTALANESDAIDFVVVGGDNTSGSYSKKEKGIAYAKAVLEPLKQCKKPVLLLMGNHDDNSYKYSSTRYLQEQANNLVSKAEWNRELLQAYAPQTIVHDSQNENSAYYYYDIPKKKTRLICMDALDYTQTTDENGTILVSSLTETEGISGVGRTYWGYSQRQAEWLVNEALTADGEWNYLFFSHMGLGSSVAYSAEIREILTQYNARTVGAGNIVLWHHGHGHREASLIDEGGYCIIETATANIAQLTNSNRTFGTGEECCFDVVSASPSSVKKYAFGAGEDADLKPIL